MADLETPGKKEMLSRQNAAADQAIERLAYGFTKEEIRIVERKE